MLRHDHGGKLFLLKEGAETSFNQVEYIRWHCTGCKGITLVPKAEVEYAIAVYRSPELGEPPVVIHPRVFKTLEEAETKRAQSQGKDSPLNWVVLKRLVPGEWQDV